MTTFRLAELELVRLLRRRDLLLAVAVVAVVAWGAGAAVVASDSSVLRLETGLAVASTAELLLLSGLGFFLGVDSVTRDRESGAFLLLEQTAISGREIVAGKWMAAAGSLLLVHSVASLPLLAVGSSLERPAVRQLAGFAGIWLFAVGFVPEAMRFALTKPGERGYVATRGALVLRQAIVVLAIVLLFRSPVGYGEFSRLDLVELERAWRFGGDPPDPNVFFPRLLPPAVLFVSWQTVTAFLYARWTLARPWR